MFGKHDLEKLITVRPGTAVPSAGDRLFNDTTGVLNLPIGGAGIYVDVPGSGNPVAIDGTSNIAALDNTTGIELPFRVIQRRDTAGDAAVLPNRVLEKSQYIHNNCTLRMQFAGEGFVSPSINSWLVGGLAGATDEFEVLDESQYVLQASAHGYRTDMYNSWYNTPTQFSRYTSPVWANTTVATEENRRDVTVKTLVRNFNRQARGMQRLGLAIALDAGNGANTTSGPTVASIIAGGAGTTITIGYDKGCQPVNLLVTEERLAAFTALEAYATGTLGLGGGDLRVAPYALAENCSAGAGVEIAGNSVSAAQFAFILAIDETQAAFDEVPNTKRTLQIGYSVDANAGLISRQLITPASEGQGQSRNLRLMHENVENYNSYTSARPWGAYHVAYPNEVLDGEVYDIYTIAHCHNRVATSGMPSNSTLSTTIALVHTEQANGTTQFSTGAVNPQKTYFETALNAIMAQYNLPAVNL
jgi:hypothetical protein